MKPLIKMICFFALIFSLTACGETEKLNPDVLGELFNAEKAMFDATSNGDSAAFRKICATDYYTIDANGEARTLEETIPRVPRFKGSRVALSEQKQRVFGELALRTGRARFFMVNGQVAEILYTSGWIYRDRRWQFIHWQGTMTGMKPQLQ